MEKVTELGSAMQALMWFSEHGAQFANQAEQRRSRLGAGHRCNHLQDDRGLVYGGGYAYGVTCAEIGRRVDNVQLRGGVGEASRTVVGHVFRSLEGRMKIRSRRDVTLIQFALGARCYRSWKEGEQVRRSGPR